MPSGKTLVAPLPAGVAGHFGPELRRLVLALYHRGQTTVARLVALLGDLGVLISKRQVMRLLNEAGTRFTGEAGAVLRAGLEGAAWISVDDTGARHRARWRGLHPGRQRPLHLFRHRLFQEPAQLPGAAARRPRRLRSQ